MSRSKRGGEPERQAETKLRFEQLSMEFIDDSAARLCQNQSQFHTDLQKFVEESKRMVQSEQEKNRSLEEELTKSKKELEEKDRELNSIKERMAFYGDKRTKQDQRNVEDTLSLNRQSKVEKDYYNFVSEAYMDAIFVVRSKVKDISDVDAKRFACFIFETTYEYISANKEAMEDVFKETSTVLVNKCVALGQHCLQQREASKGNKTQDPFIPLPITFEIPFSRRTGLEYPTDVFEGFTLSIKEAAPKIDPRVLLKGVTKKINLKLAGQSSTKRKQYERLTEADLDDYIKACIQLTWRMVTLIPPLRIEYQAPTFNKDYHKIMAEFHAGSCEGRNVRYLWPGLVDGGERVVYRGQVIWAEK